MAEGAHEANIEDLSSRLQGKVLGPDSPEYDSARSVWNGMIDRYPAMIVQPAAPDDVAEAVAFARDQGLPLSVKGGGHHVAGRAVCDGGVTIDFSAMKAVEVDPDAKRVRVEPGARWGDVDRETQAFGLATTGGLDSRTGVAGLTLGGGVGYLARRFGLALDCLRAVEVVTADGRTLRASEDEHPDLFWGMRGGGGNLGIATSFEFELFEVGPEVATAQVFHPLEDAREALRFYRDFVAEQPDEVACYALFVRVPPVEPFPEERHGAPALAFVACHSGDVEKGLAALRPLEAFGSPLLAAVAPMRYTDLQQAFDAGTPNGERYYFKTHYLAGLPDEAIDALVAHAERFVGEFTAIGLEPMGGAIGRVDPDATAYPHRDVAFTLGIWAGWSDPAHDEATIQWAADSHEALAPFSTGGMYVNYLDRESEGRTDAAFGANHARLAELKREWDPENLFSMNQNVDPKRAS